MGLSFTIAAGPRQRSHSKVRLPWDSWPYFTALDSRLPQPGGPGPRIYILTEQGGPITPSGAGFPFRHLLRLAELRWRYSTPLPHGTEEYVRVTLLLAVYSQSVRLGDNPLRPTTRIFILQLYTCGYSSYVTSSLRTGWVCRLELLLVLASAIILGSEFPTWSKQQVLLASFVSRFLIILKMGMIRFSETSLDFQRTAWRYIAEDRTLQRYPSIHQKMSKHTYKGGSSYFHNAE
jgi:hypothetical protein